MDSGRLLQNGKATTAILLATPSLAALSVSLAQEHLRCWLGLLGVALLVFPGPGVLTLLIGVACVDFPGKFRLERWFVKRPAVIGTINRVRTAAGRTPLEPPLSGAAS